MAIQGVIQINHKRAQDQQGDAGVIENGHDIVNRRMRVARKSVENCGAKQAFYGGHQENRDHRIIQAGRVLRQILVSDDQKNKENQSANQMGPNISCFIMNCKNRFEALGKVIVGPISGKNVQVVLQMGRHLVEVEISHYRFVGLLGGAKKLFRNAIGDQI